MNGELVAVHAYHNYKKAILLQFGSQMKRLKIWLKENSRVIDFVSKIIIGSAAIIISAAALFVSYSAYVVAEGQLKLSEVTSEPDISISHGLVRDSSDYAAHTHLEVENTGGQAHDVGVKISSFIVVDRYSTPRTKTIVPLTGYYFAHFNMHKSQGLLFVAEGFNSNKKFGDVYNFFLSDEAKKKYGYVEIWVQNVVWVEYTTRTEKRKKVQFIQNERAADTDVSKYFNAEQAGRKASLLFRYWPHHG